MIIRAHQGIVITVEKHRSDLTFQVAEIFQGDRRLQVAAFVRERIMIFGRKFQIASPDRLAYFAEDRNRVLFKIEYVITLVVDMMPGTLQIEIPLRGRDIIDTSNQGGDCFAYRGQIAGQEGKLVNTCDFTTKTDGI